MGAKEPDNPLLPHQGQACGVGILLSSLREKTSPFGEVSF